MKKLGFFVVLVLLLAGCFWVPQERAVSLTVVDVERRGVVAANVEVFSKEDGSLLFSGTTDSLGEVCFEVSVPSLSVLVSDSVFQDRFELTLQKPENSFLRTLSSPVPGALGIVKRNSGGQSVEYLAMDPSVFVARLLLSCELGFSSPDFLFALPPRVDFPGKEFFLFPQLCPEKESGYLFALESQETFRVSGYCTRDGSGQILRSQGSIPFKDEDSPGVARTLIGSAQLYAIGDRCHSFSLAPGSDGAVNVWDLVYLLNRYNSSDSTADIGQLGDSITVPPSGPYSASVHPDGTVNVWDLILLLNAYGSTSESVNTPFAPQITSVTLHSSPDQYQVNWSMPYPSDVHEQFTLYGLNATTTFSTTTNVVGVFPKTTVSTVVPLNTAYVGLCAVNTSPPTTYYSDPFFFPVPSAPSAEVSFETNAMSVPVGSTFTVRVVASGLPTFQSARLQILKTGGISIQGVSAGTVYNTNARVFHSSQGGGLENFDSTHLYGQSSAFNSGVLLTLTCQATSPGTLGFSSMSALDSTLSTRAPSLGPSFSVSVY